MITGHDCLGEILRRNKRRKRMAALARRLGIGMPSVEEVAGWSNRELVEFNLERKR
jgi:hypothetical protein